MLVEDRQLREANQQLLQRLVLCGHTQVAIQQSIGGRATVVMEEQPGGGPVNEGGTCQHTTPTRTASRTKTGRRTREVWRQGQCNTVVLAHPSAPHKGHRMTSGQREHRQGQLSPLDAPVAAPPNHCLLNVAQSHASCNWGQTGSMETGIGGHKHVLCRGTGQGTATGRTTVATHIVTVRLLRLGWRKQNRSSNNSPTNLNVGELRVYHHSVRCFVGGCCACGAVFACLPIHDPTVSQSVSRQRMYHHHNQPHTHTVAVRCHVRTWRR